jgi:hypothetical protein
MSMSLTSDDLKAVRQAVDESINDRVPAIIKAEVKPMFEELEDRISGAFEDMQKDIDGIKQDVKSVKITVRHIEVRGTLRA